MQRATVLVILFLFVLPLTLAAYPGDPGFRGCVLSNDDGTFNDLDCDKVPDVLDNCPAVQNPVQGDVDSNGLGDLCDVVIDEIILEPHEPMQGRSALIKAGIFNNREYPIRNMQVKVEVPALGISTTEALPIMDAGQRIVKEYFLIRIPPCAPTRFTDIVIIAEYPYAPGQKEVFSTAVKVPIASSGQCAGSGEDLTVVDILDFQDVHPEQGAIYPFTIKNNWPESKAYILTVQGHEQWGIVEINPGSVIVVPAGTAREGTIRVWAYEGEEGTKSFTLNVQARDDAKQVLLRADIPKTTEMRTDMDSQFFIGIVMFLGILMLIVLILLFIGDKRRKEVKQELTKADEEKIVVKPKKKAKKPAKKKRSKK